MLMVTAVYWVSEAVPLGAAALVPAFLYPLFGVLKSSEVSTTDTKLNSCVSLSLSSVDAVSLSAAALVIRSQLIGLFRMCTNKKSAGA